MTFRIPVNRTVVLGVLALAALLLVAVVPGSPQANASSAQQTSTSCRWASIGNSQSSIFHSAIVMDTDATKAYIYGGVTDKYEVTNKVEVANLSGANASSSVVSAGSALGMVGAAGAYRAKGAAADGSALYFLGGIRDANVGDANNEVQRFVTKTNAWERISGLTGTMTDRAFAMSAYDPDHDVIWVIGGVTKCAMPEVMNGSPCTSSSLATQYLTFDATGAPKEWKTLASGNQNFYGAAAAYDSAKKRIIIAGGTTNIQTGRNTVIQLDLSDPDPTKAKFSALTAGGTAPTAYFFNGAYDAPRNMFVTYGGVRANFMQANESVPNETNVLDLGATPNPMWSKMTTTGNPGDRVAGGLVYDSKNTRVVQILGRQKYVVPAPATPPAPSANVQRAIYALTCTTVTTAPPTATTPSSGGDQPKQCPGLERLVPAPVIADAMANNTKIGGWGKLCNPNLPPGQFNTMRTWLSLQAPGKPYTPLFNSVVFKCGCP